ncbi:hypothetical protein BH20ACT2_BH20ACT2_24600 [soil metagenome]
MAAALNGSTATGLTPLMPVASTSMASYDRPGFAWIAARRRGERSEAIEAARRYAQAIGVDVALVAAVVFGSYARGDFNSWSDVDVLVLSDDLPADPQERLDVLWRRRPGGIEPVGWTLVEHQARRRRRDAARTRTTQRRRLAEGTRR